jgi:hypothetical protein
VPETNRDQQALISSLEPEQLSSAKAQHFSRRKLGPGETLLLWLLRIYVLFMLATVAFQVFSGTR